MKVLVTGSRRYTDRAAIKRALIKARATIVVEGAARGADTLARLVGHELKLDVREYPADWRIWGRSAGYLRNQQMLDQEHLPPDDPIHVCLAFPLEGSIGTRDMIARCRNAGIRVEIPDETRDLS